MWAIFLKDFPHRLLPCSWCGCSSKIFQPFHTGRSVVWAEAFSAASYWNLFSFRLEMIWLLMLRGAISWRKNFLHYYWLWPIENIQFPDPNFHSNFFTLRQFRLDDVVLQGSNLLKRLSTQAAVADWQHSVPRS